MGKNEFLRRASNTLIINGGFLDNPGLYTGEIGLVLFFFRYAGFTKNELYSAFSFYLITKIQDRIHADTPIDYKLGITGIGSTFEYLVQKGYIEADTDDILKDVDGKIFSLQSIPYLSLDELLGIGYYAFWRMSGESVKKNVILNKILPQVVNFMEEKSKSHEPVHPAISFFKNIVSPENAITFDGIYRKPAWNHLRSKNSLYRLDSPLYSRLLEQISKSDSFGINEFDLGIQNGLAGLGLSLLTELDGDESWTSLFPI